MPRALAHCAIAACATAAPLARGAGRAPARALVHARVDPRLVAPLRRFMSSGPLAAASAGQPVTDVAGGATAAGPVLMSIALGIASIDMTIGK